MMMECMRCGYRFDEADALTKVDAVDGVEGYKYSVCPKCGYEYLKKAEEVDGFKTLIDREMEDLLEHYKNHRDEFLEAVDEWLERKY